MSDRDPPRMRPLTVLVVDDARSERVLLRHALTDLHRRLTILEAGDHAEALALFQKRAIDIVFLDIRMPGIGGIELLQDILELDPGAFVVMVSHFSTREHVVRALRLGAADFVVKPFSYAKLAEIFARYDAERAEAVRLSGPAA